MPNFARNYVATSAALLFMVGSAWQGAASCFIGYDQSFIAAKAPIIVSGELVAIDPAKTQAREGKTLRYLDGARIKVQRIHKNVLADIEVRERGEITAFMHSTNTAIPGSDSGSKQLLYSKSTDLSYQIGTKAVWFIFLDQDGRLIINRHPQQCLIFMKDRAPPVPVAFGITERTFSKDEWVKQGRSQLRAEGINPGSRGTFSGDDPAEGLRCAPLFSCLSSLRPRS